MLSFKQILSESDINIAWYNTQWSSTTYFLRGTWKRVRDKYLFMRHVCLRLREECRVCGRLCYAVCAKCLCWWHCSAYAQWLLIDTVWQGAEEGILCTVCTWVVIFFLFFYFILTPNQHSEVDEMRVSECMVYENERAEVGGISCLKNNLRQPRQERKTISKLQGTLIF